MSDSPDNIDNIDKKFTFKIKIVQKDLVYDETFLKMMTENLTMSNFPMMSQNSSYISRLNFINSYEGGSVTEYADTAKYSGYAEEEENRNSINSINSINLCAKKDGNSKQAKQVRQIKKTQQDEIGNNVFKVNIANPEIEEEVKLKKEKIIREKVAERINMMRIMQQTHNAQNIQKTSADVREDEWVNIEIESLESIKPQEVDILASLNAFEQLNNTNETDITGIIHDYIDETNDANDTDNIDIIDNAENMDNMEDSDDDMAYMEYTDDADYFYDDKSYAGQNAVLMPITGNLEIKFDAQGSIRFLSDSLLEVKYDESEMTGIKDSYVRFLFDMNKKDLVLINRGEETDIWLDCEKGKRISHQKEICHSGIIITICTKKLINKMTPDGGQLYIQYIRETDGSPSEMITHSLFAIPVRE